MADPTSGAQHLETRKPGLRNRLSYHVSTIKRWILWLVVIFIVVQVIFIAAKMMAHRPNERMCWDASMCMTYCDFSKEGVCLRPESYDTDTISQSLKLFATGKRNVIEVFNPQQGYCACQSTEGKEKRTDVFYKFYSENKQ
ncbi:MAG: hypothetical protein PHY34_04635 [Patescibacteria group bacterium]|nr:hypothetical protein [Patescibacteria group bacterium]